MSVPRIPESSAKESTKVAHLKRAPTEFVSFRDHPDPLGQINIVLAPGTPTGDAVPLQLQVGGIISTNQLTIAVSQRDWILTQKTQERCRIAEPAMRSVKLPIRPCYRGVGQGSILQKLGIGRTAQAPQFSQPRKPDFWGRPIDARRLGLQCPSRGRHILDCLFFGWPLPARRNRPRERLVEEPLLNPHMHACIN
jgi:hypothetical protein